MYIYTVCIYIQYVYIYIHIYIYTMCPPSYYQSASGPMVTHALLLKCSILFINNRAIYTRMIKK